VTILDARMNAPFRAVALVLRRAKLVRLCIAG
jgi:hypothetical protein